MPHSISMIIAQDISVISFIISDLIIKINKIGLKVFFQHTFHLIKVDLISEIYHTFAEFPTLKTNRISRCQATL